MQSYLDLLKLDDSYKIEVGGVYTSIKPQTMNLIRKIKVVSIYRFNCILCRCRVKIKNKHTLLLKSKDYNFIMEVESTDYEKLIFSSFDGKEKIFKPRTKYLYCVNWEYGLRDLSKYNLASDKRVDESNEIYVYKRLRNFKYEYISTMRCDQENGIIYLSGNINNKCVLEV